MIDKNGLYTKFSIKRTDGTELPGNAVFFVLRLDLHGDDDDTFAARDAAINYAIAVNNVELLHDIEALIETVEV